MTVSEKEEFTVVGSSFFGKKVRHAIDKLIFKDI